MERRRRIRLCAICMIRLLGIPLVLTSMENLWLRVRHLDTDLQTPSVRQWVSSHREVQWVAGLVGAVVGPQGTSGPVNLVAVIDKWTPLLNLQPQMPGLRGICGAGARIRGPPHSAKLGMNVQLVALARGRRRSPEPLRTRFALRTCVVQRVDVIAGDTAVAGKLVGVIDKWRLPFQLGVNSHPPMSTHTMHPAILVSLRLESRCAYRTEVRHRMSGRSIRGRNRDRPIGLLFVSMDLQLDKCARSVGCTLEK